MTPEQVLEDMLTITEDEFRAKLKKMSKKERQETDESIDAVQKLTMIAAITDRQRPHDLVELAEEMGFEGVEEILARSPETPYSEHRHLCGSCETVFKHSPWDIKPGNGDMAHTCPTCKERVTVIYRGEKPATITNNGEKENGKKRRSRKADREVQQTA